MHPILDVIERHAGERAGHPAAIDPIVRFDYATFVAVARGLAGQIRDATQQPHVGVLVPTTAVGAASIVACWYAGRVPVPLNFLLAPEELARILRDAQIDFVVTIDRFEAALRPAGVRTLVLSPATVRPGRIDAPQAAGDQTAVILYTSGTSGDPKGVCLSFDNLTKNVTSAVEYARIDPDQRLISVLPQFHSFGFTALTLLPLWLGATAWFIPRFSPQAVVQTIRDNRITIIMAIPSMFGVLARLKEARREDFRSIYLAISGGEPLPKRVYEAFRDRFGVELLEGYGLTETSPVVSLNVPGAHRPGSVGRPLPGIEVQAVDSEGRPQPAGTDGELVVRGHCVMQGYYRKPELTAQVVRDGALHTGDVGRLDADGFLYITGRAKEIMIIGGENVAPAEIENVLLEHPQVAEAAVIGVPDEVRGEVPVAFVIPQEGADPEPNELRGFCRDRLAGYKVPREVRIERDLPRGPTGKILKRALRKALGGS